MTITIPEDLEAQVRERAEEAGYATPDELVRTLLREYLTEHEEDTPELRAKLDRAEAQSAAGEFVEFAASEVGELAEQVKARGRARLAR